MRTPHEKAVPLHFVFEQASVVDYVILVHAEAPLRVDPVQSCAAFSQNGHVRHWLWNTLRLEGLHRRLVYLFRHLVVQREGDLGLGLSWDFRVCFEAVPAGHLDTRGEVD